MMSTVNAIPTHGMRLDFRLIAFAVHAQIRKTILDEDVMAGIRIPFIHLMSTMLVASVAALVSTPCGAQSVPFTSSNLPVVIIDTDGQPIPDEPKIAVRMGVSHHPGQRNYSDSIPNHFTGTVAIELRGNSSLDYPQKQYLFETRDSLDQEWNIPLLGFPKEHEWILYAPYVDKSLLRNVLTYRIANEMGRYASRTHFCEVLLNDEYQGLYVLMEKIKRDKHRVDIGKLEPTELRGDDVTGGYIIAIDNGAKDTDLGFPGAFDNAGYFVYWHVYPTSSNIALEQRWYIQDYIKDFEQTMHEPWFADRYHGYHIFLDVDSFVDYILINEFANNVDGYLSSVYLHKDKASKNGKLVAGPVWDFNIAYGNANYSDADITSGWRIHHGRVPFWWTRLLQDTMFVQRITKRWSTLRSGPLRMQRIVEHIDSLALVLDEAQQRHFARWQLLGCEIWPNAFVGQSWQEEVDYLKHWIEWRLKWMDENLWSIQVPLEPLAVETASTAPTRPVLQAFPTTSKGNLLVTVTLPQSMTVQLAVFDALGRAAYRGEQQALPAGQHRFELELSAVPSGCYHIALHGKDGMIATQRVIVKK